MADGSKLRRWPWALTALAVLLVLGAAGWHYLGPLSAERRTFVGEWQWRADQSSPVGPSWVMDYRADGTCASRFADATGAFTLANPPARWRLAGGRLTVRPAIGNVGELVGAVLGRYGHVTLTPDGPNRYRYTSDGPDGSPQTGTLTRVAAAGDAP